MIIIKSVPVNAGVVQKKVGNFHVRARSIKGLDYVKLPLHLLELLDLLHYQFFMGLNKIKGSGFNLLIYLWR